MLLWLSNCRYSSKAAIYTTASYSQQAILCLQDVLLMRLEQVIFCSVTHMRCMLVVSWPESSIVRKHDKFLSQLSVTLNTWKDNHISECVNMFKTTLPKQHTLTARHCMGTSSTSQLLNELRSLTKHNHVQLHVIRILQEPTDQTHMQCCGMPSS